MTALTDVGLAMSALVNDQEHLQGSELELQVTHSAVSALATPLGHLFLVLGTETHSGRNYLALADSFVSVQNLPAEAAIPCDTSPLPVRIARLDSATNMFQPDRWLEVLARGSFQVVTREWVT